MENNHLLLNCELGFTSTSLCIHAPDVATAKQLRKSFRTIAMHALRFNKRDAKIFFPTCDRPYQIPARMALNAMAMMGKPQPQEPEDASVENMTHLLGADYIRIHEFLIEQRKAGKIVIITSNITRDAQGKPISTENPEAGRDLCHHTNDLLLPSRAYWSAKEFAGFNYRLSWRYGRHDYERLNPQYSRLKELLAKDGFVRGYEYSLYRPDGALCSYKTDYYLCNEYCSDQVRIGISNPEDWSLIESPDSQPLLSS